MRTERGGINLTSGPDNTGDQNPERVQVQFDPDLFGGDPIAITVGDQLSDVTGVVGYSFGNYEVNVTEDFVIETLSQIEPEVTTLTGTNDQLTVASYNVLNLSADASDDTQRELLAEQIVNNLGSPDIIAVQEIQDDSGETDDGVTAADQTLQALVDAIETAGGPAYSFIDFPPEDGTSGGVPGGNIRNVYLYNADRVDVSANAISLTPDELADAGVSNPNAFDGTRDPLVVTFSFNGEDITIINNHFSSRFGSTPIFGGPQPFIQAAEEDREAQAQALNEYVDSLLADNPDANVMVVGDLNTFEFTDDLTQILPGSGDEQVLTNLVTAALEDDNAYSFIFDGNSQVLDHMFVTDRLLETAEFDIVHVNNDFTRDDSGIFFDQTAASDHEPLVGRFTLEEQTMENFTLQILHASDLEGGVDAIDNAPNFAAIVDAFEAEAEGLGYTSILLSAGDNYIPGPFFNAAQFIGDDIFNETYAALFADDLAANPDIVLDTGDGRGNVDIAIANILGFDASAVGNHEFDNGPDAFAGLINSFVDGNTIESFGALFPYLSTNLDFSNEPTLAGLTTDEILPSSAYQQLQSDLVAGEGAGPQIANATTIESHGETIGVIGATTQLVETISSTGNVTDSTGGQNNMAALATVLQPQVDALTGSGVDKVIIVSHLQQFALEQELATLMSGVDVIIAGGSDTISADATDRLDSGDTADQPYPFVATGADGNPTAIVSTDGEYSYVGRLVVEFDENGVIIPGSIDENISGAYVTDDQGVTDVTEALTIEDAIAASTKATLVDNLTSAVQEQVIQSDGTVFGETAVYLDGRREAVRTEETNFGNLTADANLAAVKGTDPSVVVSIKNGGGIRAPIGEIDGVTGELLPPQANPASGKLEGQISELDIQNSLRFNNELTLLTLTAAELALIMEHAVAATGPGNTPGQFPQVGGLSFSFDATQQAVEFDDDGNVVTEGQRIQSLAVTDEGGNVSDVIVQNGEVQGDANREIRIVTLNFLADCGDGYPLDIFGENRIDTGIGEQQALTDFLEANFPIGGPAFNEAETDPANDTRIQNLASREDTVLDGTIPDDAIVGTDDRDVLFGTRNDDFILGEGGDDVVLGRKGDDEIDAREGDDFVQAGRGDDTVSGGEGDDTLLGNAGNDSIEGGAGNDDIRGGRDNDVLRGGEGNDEIDGGRGNDNVDGGEGIDKIDYSGSRKAVNVNLQAGSATTLKSTPIGHITSEAPMATGTNGYNVTPLLTIGETLSDTSGALNSNSAGDYTPVGILDGLGAFELNGSTVRVLANHELLNFLGNSYEVSDGQGGTFEMAGARISYFDIDKETKQIVDAGIAYETIYDANGNVASDISFLQEGFQGFSRFCSSVYIKAHQFGDGRGLEAPIYFAGEEDGGNFNPVGGAEWALDVSTGDFWQIPAMGHGAWENITEIDTGTTTHVAFILADDTSPFDADRDGENEAAPMFLYVGEKDPNGDFLDQNGLRDGKLYVWIASDPDVNSPADFNGSGTQAGNWVEVDNAPQPDLASEDGSTGYDEFGYPTQSNLWSQAEALGAFQFSRPEDVATNLADGSEIVLASTGVDTFDVDPATGNGVDTFGTMYTVKTDFTDIDNPSAAVTIVYDGDADPDRALRSPDNLDWSADGYIYIQEDEAEEDTLSGEPLFGEGAANPNEAGIVRVDPATGEITRIANINRNAVLDGSVDIPSTAFDTDAGAAGEWETSGILDVSTLFGEEPGSLFLFDIQAHGIEDQTGVNPASRINDSDLVEGGQLAFLSAPGIDVTPKIEIDEIANVEAVIGTRKDDGITGDVAENTLYGEDGDDVMSGGAARDFLYGGDGNDILTGGAGTDFLKGDAGNDIFIMTLDGGTEIIVDFDAEEDQLDLTAFNFADAQDAKGNAIQLGSSVVFTLEDGNTAILQDADLDQLDEDNLIIGTQTDAIV